MSPPALAIPRDDHSIDNLYGLVEVKLSNATVVTRPDPNPWKEAIRKASEANPSSRPVTPGTPTFAYSLFDETEIHPANNMNNNNYNGNSNTGEDERQGPYWWLFGGNLRFSDVATSDMLNSACLVAWRVLICILSFSAAIVTGMYAPQPKAFLMPVSHSFLGATSLRMIFLAVKEVDDGSAPKFTYRFVQAVPSVQ